jgi:hypothetical protein
MNLKLKAALLTLGVILGFAGFVFIASIFHMVVLMASLGALIAIIYLFIYGMIGDDNG